MRLGVFRALLVTLAFCCTGLPVAADTFNFTVTADPRQYDDVYDNLLAQMQSKIGGQGVFQILCGDIDPPWNIRTRIDSRFGTSAVWYPGVGNHETETTEDMTWLRNEYTIGNDGRTPLKDFTNQDGPAGSVETTYSWDYGNAHFIMLNEYWDGGTSAGSDVARDGDVIPALLSWLSANLAATDKPVIFVCGHEPAYPENRHVGDSLDLYPANRDAFWNLLESDTRVKAYFCGHTHYYSRHIQPGGRVWQVDAGNAANDPGDGKTFINTTVTDTDVTFDVWRDGDTGVYSLYESWSVPVVVVPPTEVDTPAEAKQQADETSVRLTAGVSAVFPGFFYVENSQRTSGIRVDHSLRAPAAGTEVTIAGYVKTNPDGERYIEASSVIAGGGSQVEPYFTVQRFLGGGDWEFDAASGTGQRGVEGGVGFNTIGLLMRVTGVVTHAGPDYFYVDDGSAARDDSGNVGVRVLSYGSIVPSVGSRVTFAGVNACFKSGTKYYRLVRASDGLPRPSLLAYNDCVWESTQPTAPNVTTYGIGDGFGGSTSGLLTDFATGTQSTVSVAFTQSGGVHWQPSTSSGGTDCSAGTDAYNTFNGILSLVGVIYYGSTGWWVDVEFAGLNPAKRYEFVTTANRGEASYTTRLTKYTLSGADSYVNGSSAGTVISGASTTFCTGYNTAAGYVARWTEIDPGADGAFKVRAEVGVGGDATKAYSFDAFKLHEQP